MPKLSFQRPPEEPIDPTAGLLLALFHFVYMTDASSREAFNAIGRDVQAELFRLGLLITDRKRAN